MLSISSHAPFNLFGKNMDISIDEPSLPQQQIDISPTAIKLDYKKQYNAKHPSALSLGTPQSHNLPSPCPMTMVDNNPIPFKLAECCEWSRCHHGDQTKPMTDKKDSNSHAKQSIENGRIVEDGQWECGLFFRCAAQYLTSIYQKMPPTKHDLQAR